MGRVLCKKADPKCSAQTADSVKVTFAPSHGMVDLAFCYNPKVRSLNSSTYVYSKTGRLCRTPTFPKDAMELRKNIAWNSHKYQNVCCDMSSSWNDVNQRKQTTNLFNYLVWIYIPMNIYNLCIYIYVPKLHGSNNHQAVHREIAQTCLICGLDYRNSSSTSHGAIIATDTYIDSLLLSRGMATASCKNKHWHPH